VLENRPNETSPKETKGGGKEKIFLPVPIPFTYPKGLRWNATRRRIWQSATAPMSHAIEKAYAVSA